MVDVKSTDDASMIQSFFLLLSLAATTALRLGAAPTVRAPSDEGALAAARAAEYEAHTLPLLEHLRGRRVPFHEVDVVDSLPEMDERVSAALQASFSREMRPESAAERCSPRYQPES